MKKKAIAKRANPSNRTASAARRVLQAKSRDTVLDIAVVLIDGGHPSTAIGPIEVFHSAGLLWNALHGEAPQPRFRVSVASIDGAPVNSLCSLGLTPEFAIDDIRQTDIIMVSSAGLNTEYQVGRHAALMPWLRKWHDKGAYIAGICTGVAFLAESGLLDGREATTHWAVADTLSRHYPEVLWRPERFVTEDGQMFCGGGIYASIDLSLYLVEKFCGQEIALQCAKSLLVSMPRIRQSGYAVVPLSQPHFDDKIKEVEEYLQEHFDRDVSIDFLAERIGMGSRNFIRRFKAATGRMPGAYIQMLRVSIAKEMLEQGAVSIQTVCTKIGYEDVAFFRSLFKRHTGMTPAEYRNRFAQMGLNRGDMANGRPAA